MKRQEQREWLVRLTYEQEMNAAEPFSAAELLLAHNLPAGNSYLLTSLNSLREHQEEIDSIIARYLRTWSSARLRPIDRSILRVAINEMQFTKLAPLPVTINECVELAKRYSDETSFRFINGILSSIATDER